MDLMGSFRVLRRRWILTSALIILTLVGTAGAAVKLPWSYEATGTIVLLNSKSASAGTDSNPLLAFDPSLTSAAEVLSLAVMAPRTALTLKAAGYPDVYQVAISSSTGGPILQITATGRDKSNVERTLHGVMDEVSTQLLSLQSGVASRNMITALSLSAASQPSRSISKKAKPVIAVLGLGLVLTFVIPQLLDGLANRGQARNEIAEPKGREVYYPDDQPLSGSRGDRYSNGVAPVRRKVRTRSTFVPQRDDGVPRQGDDGVLPAEVQKQK
jgi:capsular polysaccharide biosynthesis protein